MLKKLLLTAVAAAAVSVSLAGMAGADPAANNPPGKGGVPQEASDFASDHGVPVSGPTTPGSVFSGLAQSKDPGESMPDAYGDLIDAVIAPIVGSSGFGSTPGGVGIKTFTPSCASGRHLTTDGTTALCS